MFDDTSDDRKRQMERFQKRFARQYEMFSKSPKAKIRSLTEMDYYHLGLSLNSWLGFKKFCEADGTVAQLGTLPSVALDVITLNAGINPIGEIASIQPMDNRHGLVYYRDFVAQNNRGNVGSGQKILSTLSAPDVFPNGYAAATTRGAHFLTGDPITSGTTSTMLGTSDFPNPVDPYSVNLYGSIVISGNTFSFGRSGNTITAGAAMKPNPNDGTFSQTQTVNGVTVTCYGICNFLTGQATLSFTTAPTGQCDFYADFDTLPEGGTDIQKAILQLQTKEIWARFYSLKSTIGMQEAYQLKKQFNMVAEDEIAKDLTKAVNDEIMNQAVAILLSNVPAGAAVTWNRQPVAGVDYLSHKLTLRDSMADTNALIVKQAGRGSISSWIVGRRIAAVMETLPGFTKVFDDQSFGAHIYGTLDGATVVRVPYQNVLDDLTAIGIGKGSNPYDAPMVYAPYMPLVMTNLLPVANNPLQSQRAVAVWAGLESLVPNLSATLLMTESNFSFGVHP